MRAKHLVRYADIGRLLVEHRRAGAKGLDGDAGGDDVTSVDAEALAFDLEAMGPTFVKLGPLAVDPRA